MLTYHKESIRSIYPKEGWVEQNPVEILNAVYTCIEVAVENLRELDIDPTDILTVGIANQRETVIVWDKLSGQPLYNAVGKRLIFPQSCPIEPDCCKPHLYFERNYFCISVPQQLAKGIPE